MIKYLKRNEIHVEKYDACIENSLQSRTYALSWYLDIVADSWGAFVLDDYEAVMPIPYVRAKRNLYIKKIMQPLFCQQLGVFSSDKILAQNYKEFVAQFVSLKPKTYQFNAQNSQFLKEINFSKTEKINYELNLNKSYETLKSNYSKNLKRNLIKASKSNLSIQTILIEDVILMKKTTSKIGLKNKNYEVLKKLLEEICNRKHAKILGVFHEKELIATAFFIQTGKRIIYLISSSTPKGKNAGAISLLFDSLIKEHKNSLIILDFEGSMISGVARFFRSFGAEPTLYYQVNES